MAKAKKKPFGGYTICFKGKGETLVKIFGNAPVTPSQMTKKLWNYIKKHKLSKK